MPKGVAVGEAVGEGLGVGVGAGVAVGAGVGLAVGTGVGVPVGVGVGVRVGVGLAVGTGVGVPVGAGVGVAQAAPLTTIVSTRHPTPETLESEHMRKRSLMVCPTTFGPKLAVVVTYPLELPVQALRPPIALPKAVEIVPLYPPVTKLPPTAALVISVNAPAAIFGEETSSTPPSKVFSTSRFCRKVTCAPLT